MKVSQPVIALHVLEFGAEHVRRVFEPDDQVGDVAFHHLLLLQHILDAGILDVEVDGADLFVRPGELLQHLAGLVDLRAHFLDGLLRLGNLGIEILQCRHRRSPRLGLVVGNIWGRLGD